MIELSLTLNGHPLEERIEDRLSLADLIRECENLTGTHLGCEHGVCGACTVLLDGEPVRACIVLAATAAGRRVDTIESFDSDELMNVIRQSFRDAHGLQCGFCTPGMLITVRDMILRHVCEDEATIRQALAGNICRCTGYHGIVDAVALARDRWAHALPT